MAPKAKAPETLESVEQRFASTSEKVYGRIMDLNVTQSQAQREVDNLMNLRHKLLGLYGVAEDPKWAPGCGVAAGLAAAAGGATEVSWKSKLHETVTKKTGSGEKGAISYATACVDEAAKPQKYVCTVTSAGLSKEYSGEPSLSKKLAEQAAAKAAMQGEFPIIFQALNIMSAQSAQPAKGQKRKAEAAPLEGKQALLHSLTLLLSRSTTKDDTKFEVVESDGKYTATLTLPTYAKGKEFKSAPSTSRKEAEADASNKAVAFYANVVKPLEEAHQAKKKQKQQESLEKLKAAHAEKKAAKEAAAAAK